MHRVTTVVLSVICVALLGVATNVATGAMPDGWSPYLWLAWPLLVVVMVALIAVEVARAREPRPPGRASEARARRVLLDRVRRYWVTNVLERSLHEEARIVLGIAAAVDDRRHPWSLHASGRDGFAGTLDDDASMSAVFERLDQSMVILGEPGAGKTTTLLELARDLLARAEADPEAPVPVVVNLSSWATDRRPLDRWLVDQLAERYGMPTGNAAAWVDAGEVLPLLDGLDEVAEEHRDACAEAIAAFHARQPLTPIAVCCREAEYGRLRRELPLYGTVTIQPLTRTQIERYVDRPGLAGVRAALDADPELWKFADSPLLLSIMAVAYADGPDPAAARTHTRRARLFTRYVDTMLRRRPHPIHRPERAVRYLSALAGRMRDRRQTIFVLDSINETWVPPVFVREGKLRPRFLDAEVLGRLVTCAAVTLGLTIVGYALLGPRGALVGAAGGLYGTAVATTRRYDDLSAIMQAVRRGDRPKDQRGALRAAVSGLGNLTGALGAGGFALLGIVASTVAVFLAFDRSGGRLAGLLFGLSYLLTALATTGAGQAVTDHLEGHRPPGTHRELPTGLLLHRLAVAGRAALVVGPLTGCVAALLVTSRTTPGEAARYGLLIGLTGAAMLLIRVGVGPITEQWLIRRRLARLDLLPQPLVPFLEYAVQCLFLRNVGDGYIFVHRELLEFFAEQMYHVRPEGLVYPRPPVDPAAPRLPTARRADHP
ncbi:NACHT domain-containing protein [Micromonospora sp. WMMD812]|uniref:NACHT domain-containing protein n=1 Tax=Micromonospora sp. WMMD812 TaxID=3015152 RepID=UPI00248AAAA2|nr:NACHT domain-containing protein [Micromonospora sp. WMMD812]WBB65952.1 NACHT domain-containing protein [Micromonospora sp. WMMD812]